ncbi:MAG: hypothetical protein R8K20_01980 [Gallionellaceae bacterium]
MNLNHMKLTLLLTIFASGIATAQTNPWQNSYTLEKAGQYARAISALTPALSDRSNQEFLLMRRAWLNYMEGQYNDSLDDYNQVLAINPKSLEAQLGLTLPLMAQLRWREAAIAARKVISASTWDYTANVRLMTCEEAEHKWADLSRHASALSARYPSDATVLVYLARAEAWQGKIYKAKSAYAKVLARTPAHIEATAYIKAHP